METNFLTVREVATMRKIEKMTFSEKLLVLSWQYLLAAILTGASIVFLVSECYGLDLKEIVA